MQSLAISADTLLLILQGELPVLFESPCPNTVQPGSNFAEIEILRQDQVDRGGAEGVSFQADETTHFVARILNQVVSVGGNAQHNRDCKEEENC